MVAGHPDLITTLKTPWWQPQLGDHRAIGKIVTDVYDIEQCIQIILTTPKGTDPFRPEFAADFLSYIDWPIQKASPFIIRESVKAILTWEPRVNVRSIRVQATRPEYASLVLEADWELRLDPKIARTTEVVI